MNQKHRPAFFRSIFLLVSFMMIIPHLHGETGPVFNGRLITTFAVSDNLDDPVPHYADFTGHQKALSLRESELGLSLGLNTVDIAAGFDFMGPGVQLVTLSAAWEIGRFSFLLGKDENLVSTSEESLFYDGHFTSGGIQTGARANQNQFRVTWEPASNFSLSLALTDEKAVSGGSDGMDFELKGPGYEAAAGYTHGPADLRIAVHRSSMELDSGEQFHPTLLLTDLNLKLPFSLQLYVASYRKQAGSQFVPLDPLVDYIRLPEGKLFQVQAVGSMCQLILERQRLSAWIGAGLYRVADHTKRELVQHGDSHVLVRNERLSAGISWKPSAHWHIGIEFATFSTDHLESGLLSHGSGSILVCKLTRSF